MGNGSNINTAAGKIISDLLKNLTDHRDQTEGKFSGGCAGKGCGWIQKFTCAQSFFYLTTSQNG